MTSGQRRTTYLLRKYGITQQDFEKLLKDQGGVCFICESPPKTKNLHVDHVHVKGYKKLSPPQKALYVRGLLCFQCNKLLMGKHMTLPKAGRIIEYLTRFLDNNVWK